MRCSRSRAQRVTDIEQKLNNYEALLADFRTLPARVGRPPTFMEIAGYPHYENVCSNILVFFLDPEQPHGLGTLMLDALARVGSIVSTSGEGVGGNVSIEREVITEAGNRIDILIESDAHAIVIENNIRAGINNPFADYSEYLDRLAPEDRDHHRLLLTLSPTEEASEWGFKNFTYTDFVAEIRAMLGQYVAEADTRYLTLLLDFLNTMENLHKETRMNEQFVGFLSERYDEIEALLGEIKTFRDELRRKVRALGALVDVEEYQNVSQWVYREQTSLYDMLGHDIRVYDDLPVIVDTTIYPSGWEVAVELRRGSGIESRLSELLRHLDITVEDERDFVHARFRYDESMERIAPVVQSLVDKFATSREVSG